VVIPFHTAATYFDSVYPKTFNLFMEVKDLLEELTYMDLEDVKKHAHGMREDFLAKSKSAVKYQVQHTKVSMQFQNLNEEMGSIVRALKKEGENKEIDNLHGVGDGNIHRYTKRDFPKGAHGGCSRSRGPFWRLWGRTGATAAANMFKTGVQSGKAASKSYTSMRNVVVLQEWVGRFGIVIDVFAEMLLAIGCHLKCIRGAKIFLGNGSGEGQESCGMQ
jgi:hypothetical protein